MEKDKKYTLVLGLMIFFFILFVGVCVAWGLGFIGINITKTNDSILENSQNPDEETNVSSQQTNDNNTNTQQIKENSKNDIYGYSLLSYTPADGSFKEYYKIVELHKNNSDNILVSYDVNKQNSIDKVNRIYGLKIIGDKLYYQLHYNSTDNGILTYNNIMCIDLSSNNKEPFEILNWKQTEQNYNKSIRDFKVLDNYIYFNTIEYEYYKYDINTKKVSVTTENDYENVIEINSNYKKGNNKIYIDGKELKIDDTATKLIYDEKLLYAVTNGSLSLNYSTAGEILFSETKNCNKQFCEEYNEYKYDLNTNQTVNMNHATWFGYGMETLYKQ